MRRWRLRLLVSALLLAGLAGPGQAAERRPLLHRVAWPDCRVAFASAAVDQGAGGRLRGFVAHNGEGCDPDRRVRFVEGAGVRWAAPEVTPYRGVVLAAASDTGGTWLLYRAPGGIWLGRRTGPGVYTRPRRLALLPLPAASPPSGDLVAAGGRWWAVWSEPVAAGGGRLQSELFEAGTLRGEPVDRRPVTDHPASDEQPSLTLAPGGGLRLAWVRRGQDATTSQVLLGERRAGGAWRSQVVSSPWTLNLSPTLSVDRHGPTLAWQQDASMVVRTPTGPSPVRVSATPGVQPRLATGGGRLLLGWTQPGTPGRGAVVAERRAAGWLVHPAAPDLDARQELVGLASGPGGGATALLLTEQGALYAATLPGR